MKCQSQEMDLREFDNWSKPAPECLEESGVQRFGWHLCPGCAEALDVMATFVARKL